MSRFLFGTALFSALALTSVLAGEAQAQFGPNPFNGTPNGSQTNWGGQNQGSTLTLPPSVKKVVSVDAHNMLLAEVEDKNGETSVVQMKVDHNYTGGIARMFGGDVVPTGPFVSPAFTNGSGFGNTSPFSVSGVGNFNNGLNNGVFNNGNLNGNGFPGFNGGFQPNTLGPNTTVTGSGIFAPRAQQVPRAQIRK